MVCDNLPAHKVLGIRQCLEDAGMGLLYLPPYSPDFNPIEQVFAKLKALLRREAPRSFDAIVAALKHILKRFHPPRVRQLPPALRLCANMSESDSRLAQCHPRHHGISDHRNTIHLDARHATVLRLIKDIIR